MRINRTFSIEEEIYYILKKNTDRGRMSDLINELLKAALSLDNNEHVQDRKKLETEISELQLELASKNHQLVTIKKKEKEELDKIMKVIKSDGNRIQIIKG